MKNYFFTGLAILIPIVLTFAIIQFLINLFTIPFLSFIEAIFDHARGHHLAVALTKLLILIFLVAAIIIIGVFGRIVFIRGLFRYVDHLIKRTPGVKGIYQSIKEAVHAYVRPDSSCFSKVVLVRFPHWNGYSIGFIMRENKPSEEIPFASAIAVFVPTAPNPTFGYMQLCKKEELIYLEMKVEDAIKLIISCGIIIKPLV